MGKSRQTTAVANIDTQHSQRLTKQTTHPQFTEDIAVNEKSHRTLDHRKHSGEGRDHSRSQSQDPRGDQSASAEVVLHQPHGKAPSPPSPPVGSYLYDEPTRK